MLFISRMRSYLRVLTKVRDSKLEIVPSKINQKRQRLIIGIKNKLTVVAVLYSSGIRAQATIPTRRIRCKLSLMLLENRALSQLILAQEIKF